MYSYTSLKTEGKAPKEQANFLLKDQNMKGLPLGVCLDSCRWGSITTVMYEMSVSDMVFFIKKWMQQNKDNLENLISEDSYELPYLNHNLCPSDKSHKGRVFDLAGRERCAYKTEKRLRPNYVYYYDSLDEASKTTRRKYYEEEPSCSIPDDAFDKYGNLDPFYKEDYENYLTEFKKFENEEKTFVVEDVCYAILSDRRSILPLETIIKRLNLAPTSRTVYCSSTYSYHGPCKRLNELNEGNRENYEYLGICPGHEQEVENIIFHFDGYALASYVKSWWKQVPSGKAPPFEPNKR